MSPEDEFIARLTSESVPFTTFVLNGAMLGFFRSPADLRDFTLALQNVYIADARVHIRQGQSFAIRIKDKYDGIPHTDLVNHSLAEIYDILIR